MNSQREELKLDVEGTRYLTEIFQGKWIIHNPTELDISGLGKIVATSTLLQRCREGEVESYFAFCKEESSGEIIKIDTSYYIQRRS